MSFSPAIAVVCRIRIFLLVMAAFWLLTSRSNADCGNYVTIAGQPAMHHREPDGQTPSAPICHGPGCNAPQPTPFTLTTKFTVPAKEPGIFSQFQSDSPSRERSYFAELIPMTASHSADSIFHPPKAA
jgi:hypothetical protein